jgi:hypothetical protein
MIAGGGKTRRLGKKLKSFSVVVKVGRFPAFVAGSLLEYASEHSRFPALS